MKTVNMSVLALLIGLVPGAGAQTTLRLRAGVDAQVESVKGVSLAGVECVVHGGATVVLSWDKVAEVRGGAIGEAAREYSALADHAWRARTRLSRGDALGAEPLFEELFARFEEQTGPTAAMVSSGLLRCRATRQAQAASVAPWLALVASGMKEATFDSAIMAADGIVIAPLVDEATGLAPSLPPIWFPSPSLQTVIGLREWSASGVEEPISKRRARALRSLYVRAARATMGEPVTLDPRPDLDEALMLVWDVVAVRFGTEQQQQQARVQLRQRIAIADVPLWVEAWCRVSLGMAMVRDSDAEQRLLGLAHLAHAPARLESASPYLAGVALAEIARVLDQHGSSGASSRAWRVLEERFPDHPALAGRARQDADTAGSDEHDAETGGQP